MSDATYLFNDAFQAIYPGNSPFRWQRRLFELLASGRVPRTCSLPTGFGKTSIIPIWLTALAHPRRPSGGRAPLPRRLVYVVNRRTVVDQATDTAERIRRIIEKPTEAKQFAGAASRLRDALTLMSGHRANLPLAVSTLRGELADNGEWKQNPACPAIIVGTVDMIGSKLLFSGYGDGRYGRAHHAGLIGQDALIVHDEAHLSPAFDSLLRAVATEQDRCKEARPLRVMSLSATTRAESGCATPADSIFGVEDEDRKDALVEQRLKATKSLKYVETEKDKLDAAIAKEALTLGLAPGRVLIYVRSPQQAAKVAKAIEKGLGKGCESRIALLTGTIRGLERDALAKGPILTAFWANPHRERLAQSMFLISTSAGEVGADFDADHLVCDQTPLDSMIQRFGRVNRLGGNDRRAQIVVVGQKQNAKGEQGAGKSRKAKSKLPDAYAAAIIKTGELMRGIASNGGDVSPAALGRLIAGLSVDEKRAAFTPAPTIPPATDILFDAWALTSIAGAMPNRPIVEPYLHGMADWEPPETRVAWRADVSLLAAADVRCSDDELEQVFDAFPLRSAEQLRDRTERVQAELRKIAERLREDARCRAASTPANNTDSDDRSATGDENESRGDAASKEDRSIEPNPWIVLMRGGSVEWVLLEDVAPPNKDDATREQRRLAFATVVLPAEAGGLTKAGILDGNQSVEDGPTALDVAEITATGQRVRQRALVRADETQVALLGDEVNEDMPTKMRLALPNGGIDNNGAVSAIVAIEYRVAKGESGEPGNRILLDDHNSAVGAVAGGVADALGLSDDIKTAVSLAGWLHDLGKSRERWQQYANNPRPSSPNAPYDRLAKNKRYRDPRKTLQGYRHEFGSLCDATADHEIRALDPDTRDLVLHLIAAHHGWARPHFEPRHFDPGDPGAPRRTVENERVSVEVMQRFARLQQRYGRWGLAWLESILRCADAEASESQAATGNRTGTAAARDSDTPGGAA